MVNNNTQSHSRCVSDNRIDKRLGIIIPYRDRKEHLDIFIPFLADHLEKQGIDHQFFIIEQNDNQKFNRGSLINIGTYLAWDMVDYFCMHDVDMLPESRADYRYSSGLTHMVGWIANIEKPLGIVDSQVFRFFGPDYVGGVIVYDKKTFIDLNGFSNNFWGWGWEDNDLFNRIRYSSGIRFNRPGYRYYHLHHPPNRKFDIISRMNRDCNKLLCKTMMLMYENRIKTDSPILEEIPNKFSFEKQDDSKLNWYKITFKKYRGNVVLEYFVLLFYWIYLNLYLIVIQFISPFRELY